MTSNLAVTRSQRAGNSTKAGSVTATTQSNRMNASITPVPAKAVKLNRDSSADEEVSNKELKALILNMNKELISMKKEFTTMKEDLTKKVNDTQIEVNKLGAEVANLRTDMGTTRNAVTEVEKSVEFSSEKLDQFEQNTVPEMKKDFKRQLDELNEKLLRSELHDRKMNLIYYGVPEPTSEHGEDCYETLADIFEDEYELTKKDTRDILIANVHRIPVRNRRTYNGTPVPLPLIVRFVYARDRNYFLDQRRITRQGSRIRVSQDLPRQMSQERGRLGQLAYKLRQNNGYFTRIQVKDTKVYLQFRDRRPGAEWQVYKE